jgi:hypothetical protein
MRRFWKCPDEREQDGWNLVHHEGSADYIFRSREEAVKKKAEETAIPPLPKLRTYVRKNKVCGNWNYWKRNNGNPIENFFAGNCHSASAALSKMLIGNEDLVVRGWYTDTEALKDDSAWIRNEHGHIGHSWVELNGKIIDPTWWAFHPGQPVKVYEFDNKDPRYHTRNIYERV